MLQGRITKEHIAYAERLANQFYRRKGHRGLRLDELKSCAYLGLCQAAKTYEENEDRTFESFSYLRIVGAMYDHIADQGGFTRALHRRKNGKRKARANQSAFAIEKYNVAYSISELANVERLAEEWGIRLHFSQNKKHVALAYLNERSVDDLLEVKEMATSALNAFDKLEERERRVVALKVMEGRTLEEIHVYYPEVSKSTLSRTATRALKKLQSSAAIEEVLV